METKDTPQGVLGLKFAQALVSGRYAAAREMLSPKLTSEYSMADLQRHYEAMTAYVRDDGPATDIEVLNNEIIGSESLNAKGWAYVSINGGNWCEAVTITARPFEKGYLIDELIWGRP